ncbi:hypothetical protein ACCO45_009574 [Purpureocillium lilacinum]|uniref:Uncharacterized protein n=1 Tax=Purpureocillium lilacinum TaxID=33203 RepID=A0ACC4DKU3_PURLI
MGAQYEVLRSWVKLPVADGVDRIRSSVYFAPVVFRRVRRDILVPHILHGERSGQRAGAPVAPRDSAQSAHTEVTAEGRVAPCAGAAAWTVHAVLAVVRDRATAAAPAGDRSTGRAAAMRGIEIQRLVGLVGPPLGQPLSHFLADPGLLHRSPVVVSWLMIHRCNTKSSISRAITVGLSLTFSTTLCMTFSHCTPASERTRHI